MSTSSRPRGRPKNHELTTRRRAEILDAAGRLFAEHGFPSLDVQVVADELGVGKGTVYRYFASKRELFLAAVDRGMRLLQEEVDAAAPDTLDPLDQVTRAISAYLAYFDTHVEFVELIIQERAEFKDRTKPTYFVHRDANMGRWRTLFDRLIAARQLRTISTDRILDVISDVLYGTIFTNHFAGRRKCLEAQAEDILDIVFHGILGDRGRAKPDSDSLPTEQKP